MNLPPKIKTAIDIGGLLTALVVDLVLNIICFKTLAPDWVSMIAFISIGIMIVLFVFRSWSKRQYIPWLIFVSVVFFFDYSYMLETTRVQSVELTQETDSEIVRLDNSIADATEAIKDLRAQYKEAMQRDTMDQIQTQIEVENSKLEQYEADRTARFNLVETGVTHKTVISADNIFNAIPNAIKAKRIIPVIIFALCFLGLQLVVVTSLDRDEKIKAPVIPKEQPTPVQKKVIRDEDIRRFIKWSWIRVSEKTSNSVVPRQVFFDLVNKQNIEFDRDIYDTLVKVCIKENLVNKDGRAVIEDEDQIFKVIKKSDLV